MHKILILCAFVYLLLCQNITASVDDWQKAVHENFTLHYRTDDSNNVCTLEAYLENGINTVQKYFHKSYKKKFDVYIFPSRKELDAQWEKDWNVPGFKSECWMVASGVAHRLNILSINRWKSEACEHNPDDINATQKIITHELMHVFHGQLNPVPDFTGLDDLGWFVEGIAVLVSGQLDSTRIKDLAEARDMDKLPDKLTNFWTGKYRYSFSGSIVQFIENRYGKDVINKLQECTKNVEMLNLLNTSEEKILKDWKEYVSNEQN